MSSVDTPLQGASMNRTTLELFSYDGIERVAYMSWSNGRVRHIWAKRAEFRKQLEWTVERGLYEWIGPDGDKRPRLTSSDDPSFVERLAALVRRESILVVELHRDWMEVPVASITNQLRVLLYLDEEDAPGKWIALSLDMDLLGYGDTQYEALVYLRDIVEIQISFALAENSPELIPFPAEQKYFDLYEQGREVDFDEDWIVREKS